MRSIQAGPLALAGVFIIATVLKSQAPAATVWEYSSITSDGIVMLEQHAGQSQPTSRAYVCHGNTQGCRSEEVISTSDDNNKSDAMMKAANTLGSQGWELTTALGPSNGQST